MAEPAAALRPEIKFVQAAHLGRHILLCSLHMAELALVRIALVLQLLPLARCWCGVNIHIIFFGLVFNEQRPHSYSFLQTPKLNLNK